MKVWQIAAGERSRDYSELFLAHDLMLIGTDHLDDDARSSQYADGVHNSRNSRRVYRFAHEVDPGDRVLMRSGQKVISVGEIPSEAEHQYEFDSTFRSVYGWDLQHLRRVKWAADLELGDELVMAFRGKRMARFGQVRDSYILAAVRNLDAAHFAAPLNELPPTDTRVYTDDKLRVELSRAGVNNKNIEDIVAKLSQAKHLISWYRTDGSGRKLAEYEVVSHIVLPLFLGLGWSYKQIAVEWNKVDMAFFERTPATEANCVMVLEAKGLERGLSQILHQPQDYVRRLGLEGVRHIVTTNGTELFVYEKSGTDWNPNPVGYLSIPSLQREYVRPKGTNLIDTLVRLQPNTIQD